MVENLETISAQIPLPDSGVLKINRTTYSLVVSEVNADDIPTEGFDVSFDGDSSDSVKLPKLLFANGNTRVTASRITTIELFKGPDTLKVVASNIVSFDLAGQIVSNLEEDIVISITKQTAVSFVCVLYMYLYICLSIRNPVFCIFTFANTLRNHHSYVVCMDITLCVSEYL